MICAACKAGQHDDCGSYQHEQPHTICGCQHQYGRVAVITPDGQSSGARVLLGVHTPASACTCFEHVDQARGRVAVPPPAGCAEHGYQARWVGAAVEPELEE